MINMANWNQRMYRSYQIVTSEVIDGVAEDRFTKSPIQPPNITLPSPKDQDFKPNTDD